MYAILASGLRSWGGLFALLVVCGALSWVAADTLASRLVERYRDRIPPERLRRARRVARANIAGLLFAALMAFLMVKLYVPVSW